MKIRTQPSLITVTLCLLATGAQAAPLAPTRGSEVVTLFGNSGQPVCQNGPNSIKVQFKNNADGTQSSGYVVPPGQVLVITDVEYRVTSGPAGADFQGVLIADQGSAQFAMIAGPNIDGNGIAIGSRHWAQGPVVKGGTPLCFTERQGRPIGPDSQVHVHGFLARDR